MEYDNNREFILRKVVSDNPNAPMMATNGEIDGVPHKLAFWPMKRKDGSLVKDKNGNQLYKGKLEVDEYKQQQPPAQQEPEPKPEFDDDIPF